MIVNRQNVVCPSHVVLYDDHQIFDGTLTDCTAFQRRLFETLKHILPYTQSIAAVAEVRLEKVDKVVARIVIERISDDEKQAYLNMPYVVENKNDYVGRECKVVHDDFICADFPNDCATAYDLNEFGDTVIPYDDDCQTPPIYFVRVKGHETREYAFFEAMLQPI